MRKNSIKNTRINTEVQRELSNILRGGITPESGADDFRGSGGSST